MIKFFKIFINILYAFFTMGMIAMVIWAANWTVNTGGETHDVPNLVANIDDDQDKTVYFSDIFKFDSVSIANATKSHEICMGGTEEEILWGINVRWANTACTWTKNVITAVVSPSYEIEQMERYRYGVFVTKLYPDDLTSDIYVIIDSSEITLDNYKSLDVPIYGIMFGSRDEPYVIGSEFTYEEVIENGEIWRFDTPIQDLSLNDESLQFNEVAKFSKYNQEEYDHFEKFLYNKTVVKWAFAEVIIIVILTGFVVYQNPIDFTKNESTGVTEINRTFLPRIPLPRRRVPKRFREVDEDNRKRR